MLSIRRLRKELLALSTLQPLLMFAAQVVAFRTLGAGGWPLALAISGFQLGLSRLQVHQSLEILVSERVHWVEEMTLQNGMVELSERQRRGHKVPLDVDAFWSSMRAEAVNEARREATMTTVKIELGVEEKPRAAWSFLGGGVVILVSLMAAALLGVA